MIKKLFNHIEHYWSSGSGSTADSSSNSTGIVTSKSVKPNRLASSSASGSSSLVTSPSHSVHEGLAHLEHLQQQQRSDPNTLPHCWTVSSHGTMDRGLADIVELRSLSTAAASVNPRQMLNTRWGHRFLLVSLAQPTYCDFCGEALFGTAHRCEFCCTSCHPACSERLCLSCRRPSPFNRDNNGDSVDDLSPFDVFETAKSDLWTALGSSDGVAAAVGASSSSRADQEAVAYTPRLRGHQQQQQQPRTSASSNQGRRRARSSSADTLLSGQNSLLLSPGGEDQEEVGNERGYSSSSSDEDGSCGASSMDLLSPMPSLPAPPSPPNQQRRASQQQRRQRRQHDADACECGFASLLSSEAAYSLSSLDAAALAESGIRVLQEEEATSAASGTAFSSSEGVASVTETRTFYCDWTPERLRRHLNELTARLPGQEFRPIRSSSSSAATNDKDCAGGDGDSAIRQSEPPKFRGSLRVHVNLLRPVRAEQPAEAFFLPQGNATLLHDLDSRDTADRVVALLLAKHRIRDPPHKFALFQHEIRGDRTVKVRKLMQHERPLEILLSWTTLPPAEMQLAFERRKFILQENESSNVDWRAFTIPELNNFLLILSLEEQQRAKEIRLAFDITKSQLRRRLFELDKQRQQQQQKQQPEQKETANPAESDV